MRSDFRAQKSVDVAVGVMYLESMSALPHVNEMRRATTRRDASYDGVFFLGVRTTGIFCRPSCPAKKPLPRNVQYFGTARDALFAGYRPCKRCRPLLTDGRPPSWASRLLERVDRHPQERLADGDMRRMGIDPTRARRYFKRRYGITFQAYARARRMSEALTQIRRGQKVTDVALGHGYDSDSGFREAFGRTFGRPPGKPQEVKVVVTKILESPIGPLIIGATDEAICLLEFTERRALQAQFTALRKRVKGPVVPGSNRHIDKLAKELSEYFAGKRREFTVPLAYPGTEFQHKVWKGLLKIPYGKTTSYEELAKRVGNPGAQRAVGTANGANRIAIVIPCHRVVNKGGKLGGYGGGLWRKQFLLDLEQGKAAVVREKAAVGAGH
jgi:AraC family transcriptional regulator of adaptative response/methylated-DNA-[protein]-cysteine methyltransferase